MKIISDYRQDTNSDKPIPGSYEWWYFDALSDDGQIGLVVIFYEGNPFSGRYIDKLANAENALAEQFPAISISVYHKGRPVYYAFEEVKPSEAGFDNIEPGGKVKESHFRMKIEGENIIYYADLNHHMPTGDYIRGSLKFKSKLKIYPLADAGKGNDFHEWNLVQPRADVTGEIEIGGYKHFTFSFTGKGYHDHNKGFEPLKDCFREWYWGRFHLAGSSLIYYKINDNETWHNKAWIIDKDGATDLLNPKIMLSDKNRNLYGLSSARKIDCSSGSGNFFVQQNNVIDNGPFYKRYISRAVVERNGKTEQAHGFSEYLRPAGIYNRLFRPLVKMRIKYPDETHWIQKKPKLFRFTW